MKEYKEYAGRWFTPYQLTAEERAHAQKFETDQPDACQRCQTAFFEEHRLPNGAYYCRECLLLGRVRSDEPLYYFPQVAFPKRSFLQWSGQLTEWQNKISQALCQSFKERRPALVHAVTGAGKTEMMYAVINQAISEGGAVCIASPRIDVCIELHKRLTNDFSCPIALLHGNSEDYFRTPLVVATTHQLLKFYQAFDLIIIDEVDAFPYVDNPVLYQAVEQARKKEGVHLFLTATSTDYLNQQVKIGKLKRFSLPRRFHGNPLVVPEIKWCSPLTSFLKKGRLPQNVLQWIKEQRATNWPLLIFAPEIELGKQIATILSKEFPNENIGFVSSQTKERLETVDQFRKRQLTILVSTTILERGVTFPGVDVFVLMAEHRLFNSSSLIQISGRVGRSIDRPTGKLYFIANGRTKAIGKAITEIKEMNKEAAQNELSALSTK